MAGRHADSRRIALPIVTLAEFRAMAGKHIGTSPWLDVTQEKINLFADATGDDQYLHTDPDRAARTPFEGTIAQGFLSLALMPRLFDMADVPLPPNIKMSVNYGGNRIRFLSPVRSNSRVRGRFTLLTLDEKRPGQFQLTIEYVLEIENADKPALIAEWITQLFL
jgi:acyl dehydratase